MQPVRFVCVLLALLVPLASHAAIVVVDGSKAAAVGPLENRPGLPDGCSAGFSCLRQAYDTTGNLAFGKSVVVSSTYAPGPTLHSGQGITDGYYGNSSAWIPNVNVGTLTIDLGLVALIDAVRFGRYRAGGCCNDRLAGLMTFSTAGADMLFSPVLSAAPIPSYAGGQSVTIADVGVSARYVRLDLTTAAGNNAFAIDEVEVFGTVPLGSTLTLLVPGLLLLHRRRAAAT